MAETTLLASTRGRMRADVDALLRFDYRATLLHGPILALLIVLLALDGLAIASDATVTAAKQMGWLGDPQSYQALRMDSEYGLWAWYGYLKLFAIAGLLAAIYRRSGAQSYLLLATVYFYTALDDSLLLHERAGRLLTGVETRDGSAGGILTGIGELGYFAVVGVFILFLLGLAVARAGKDQRPQVALMALLMLVIGFCAVAVNLIEAILADFSRLAMKAASLLDDGGELVASSFALALALAFSRSGAQRAGGSPR